MRAFIRHRSHVGSRGQLCGMGLSFYPSMGFWDDLGQSNTHSQTLSLLSQTLREFLTDLTGYSQTQADSNP